MYLPFFKLASSKKFKNFGVFYLFFLGLVIFASSRQSTSASELDSTVKFKELDRWYEVFLNDSKVGYAHSIMKLENNVVFSESIFNMSINRGGISINITSFS